MAGNGRLLLLAARNCQRRMSSSNSNSYQARYKFVPEDRKEMSPDKRKKLLKEHIAGFPKIYPDFLQSVVWDRRVPLFEEIQRREMMERRLNIDIPEFYVGSILAVTTSESYLGAKEHRFVGICILREKHGLMHQFTLRNYIDGIGVEIMYDMYNPTIKKIEVLKLEKRLDDDLSYLVDALPEFSTFDFNMEPISHPAGTPVPVNPLKVKMNPPPWDRRWDLIGPRGIEDAWTLQTAWFKRKIQISKNNEFEKYDLVASYRVDSSLEFELEQEEAMREFQQQRHALPGATKRRIIKSVADSK